LGGTLKGGAGLLHVASETGHGVAGSEERGDEGGKDECEEFHDEQWGRLKKKVPKVSGK
jgi:hypothetical protein